MNETNAERWLPVADWEGLYEVSSLGRVRSLPRKDTVGRFHAGKVLRQFPQRDGYLCVGVTYGPRRRLVRVHHLVLEAFHGPRPVRTEARHLNGDRLDNRAVNLAWGTKSENCLDQVRHGTHPSTAKTHCPQGHPYDEANTRVTATGGRACRACEGRERKASKKQRRRRRVNGGTEEPAGSVPRWRRDWRKSAST